MNTWIKCLTRLITLPLLASSVAMAQAADTEALARDVLYWYDPMYPQQKFDKPGKSPFMDMDLVPRYAEEGGDAASVRIAPGITQNLGMRLATVRRTTISQSVDAVGVLAFDARDVAVVQARSGGFVERVYARAPQDVIARGAPLADLLIPQWSAAQAEFLALRDLQEPELLAAARQRLRLAGMPAELIARVERSGQVQTVWTVTSPISGVLQALSVREGMTLAAGMSLAQVNGLDPVWLEVAVPEAQAGALRQGQRVQARLPAFPGKPVEGLIQAVLPQADVQSRTVQVRVELPNPEQRLRPGMTAEVTLSSDEQSVLVVPSEAVIRTGKRTLVMVAESDGRFRPVAVRIGQEAERDTVVTDGLEEGQTVVASGQFLLDSEASLRGIIAADTPRPAAATPPALHEAEGTIVGIDDGMIELAHGPFKSLGMPGMTMPFPVGDPALLTQVKAGERVRVGVSQRDDGLFIERVEKLDEQQAGHGGHEQ
ncbi:efflux RND transporter periplasmic adaptor subunit [Ectopseudomonas khazarica]|uniref:efflux RND transporter periplasmic adaptor subunit n=1 Tax=Ectopseudomonas khazarica TaxID=2502979 RepID=UPI00106EE90F|nr:efflux RND transporter periplasmic adaptor subunit [Pseudomonas khazarica]